MIRKINLPISVITIFKPAHIIPKAIYWNSRLYYINKIGYHHQIKHGQTIQHIFSVSNDHLAFRLRLNTQTLQWYLEEISDGLAN